MSEPAESTGGERPGRQRYVPAVGPRLKKLLAVVFALFSLLAVNSVYLVTITIAGVEYQNYFYQWMFLLHLGLGLLFIVPVVLFGILHIRNAHARPNKRAVRAGYALFTTALVVLLSGLILMQVEGLIVLKDPTSRSIAYWCHALSPLLAVWLFILHRLAGRRIKWRVGLAWSAVAGVFALGMLVLQFQDPRAWNVAGNPTGAEYFEPSLARTTSVDHFIPARVLDNDAYCMECHADIHNTWLHSAHKRASFNNPFYAFSVKETRREAGVQASRFCAGCHDPVPFFSGEFDHPRFDDPDYDLGSDPMAQAGITCTVCHSIAHINSPRGNSDYTIDEPIHYPFAFSENTVLKWVNRQLVKAKPEFHKAVFLKDSVHRSTEFCGTCHKVHLPVALNKYKWLRGQNHFDAFWLSGVSGHGITSFYYPPKAQTNCNGCHMPLMASSDFGARRFEQDPEKDLFGQFAVHDHQFPAANTAIIHVLRDELPHPDEAIAAHRAFNEGVIRVDIFGVKEGGTIEGPLTAPIRSDVPALVPGETYLLETVIRTVKMGHVFTQGTSDSNEIWMDVTVRSGDRVIGRSGGMDETSRESDRWSHFVNAFVIDRDGNRINRRNAQDIFTALYNHQIPPGAADVIHYKLRVPEDVIEPITVDVKLRFRKFDTEYLRLVMDDPEYVNDLPIMTLAEDRVTFPVAGRDEAVTNDESSIVPWQRWNDYGIGLLRKGALGELRQAREAFEHVKALNRPEGPINLARVYIKEGLVQTDAPRELREAAAFDPPAREWHLLWFGAQVSKMNGDYRDAEKRLRDTVRGNFAQAKGRGFDFAKDYRVLNELASIIYQRSLRVGGAESMAMLQESEELHQQALAYDPENLNAHYGLKLVYKARGDVENEEKHHQLHLKYKPDSNAREQAATKARLKYPAANHAAEAIVIYDLHREGAPGLPGPAEEITRQ